MSFYSLKSTFKRDILGDVILNTESIESIMYREVEMEDRVDPLYALKISLNSGDDVRGIYTTKDEVKKIIKELLNNKINDEDIHEFTPMKK